MFLWIGLATFLIGLIAVFAVSYEQNSDRTKYLIPWDICNVCGAILLLEVFGAMHLISCKFMEKLDIDSETTGITYKYIIGFVTMSILATIPSGLAATRGVQLKVWVMQSFPSSLE